jgi:hypothetical protein
MIARIHPGRRRAAPRMSALVRGAILFILLPPISPAQVLVHGEAVVNFFNGEEGPSPRVVDRGLPTFGWRCDVLADAVIADDIAFLSHARFREDESITFDFLALRFTDLTPLHLNLEVGKFDVPFGNLGERRFSSRNALYSLPLMYEYPTALPTRPMTGAEILARRGLGGGMRLLEFGMYDIGAMVYGEAGIFGYAATLTNGTVSATANRLQNTNADFGRVLRVSVTPLQGLSLGLSYAEGAWMSDAAAADTTSVKRIVNAGDHVQHNVEADLEFSAGHAELHAQGMYSTYHAPVETGSVDLDAVAWFVEAKYTILPRLYVAARVNALHFGTAVLDGGSRTWDADVTETECGVGYRLDRNALCKAVYRITSTHGDDPHDNLLVLQVSVRY